jgi:hypothetical protein
MKCLKNQTGIVNWIWFLRQRCLSHDLVLTGMQGATPRYEISLNVDKLCQDSELSHTGRGKLA